MKFPEGKSSSPCWWFLFLLISLLIIVLLMMIFLLLMMMMMFVKMMISGMPYAQVYAYVVQPVLSWKVYDETPDCLPFHPSVLVAWCPTLENLFRCGPHCITVLWHSGISTAIDRYDCHLPEKPVVLTRSIFRHFSAWLRCCLLFNQLQGVLFSFTSFHYYSTFSSVPP